MKIGDAQYNNHFRHLVLGGICCGLQSPLECLIQYRRCIGEKYEDMDEIEEFCVLASFDLYSAERCIDKDDITNEMLDKWFNN